MSGASSSQARELRRYVEQLETHVTELGRDYDVAREALGKAIQRASAAEAEIARIRSIGASGAQARDLARRVEELQHMAHVDNEELMRLRRDNMSIAEENAMLRDEAAALTAENARLRAALREEHGALYSIPMPHDACSVCALAAAPQRSEASPDWWKGMPHFPALCYYTGSVAVSGICPDHKVDSCLAAYVQVAAVEAAREAGRG